MLDFSSEELTPEQRKMLQLSDIQTKIKDFTNQLHRLEELKENSDSIKGQKKQLGVKIERLKKEQARLKKNLKKHEAPLPSLET